MLVGSFLSERDPDNLKMNLVTILKSKIHRATITELNPDYEGSITLDPQLMAAGIVEYEAATQLIDVSHYHPKIILVDEQNRVIGGGEE